MGTTMEKSLISRTGIFYDGNQQYKKNGIWGLGLKKEWLESAKKMVKLEGPTSVESGTNYYTTVSKPTEAQ